MQVGVSANTLSQKFNHLEENMSTIARVLSASVIAGGAMIFAGSTQASAACKTHSHSSTGSASGIQYLASVSAKYAWKSAVASHDGVSYSIWSLAKNKSVSCKKSGANTTWVCTAKGQPCN